MLWWCRLFDAADYHTKISRTIYRMAQMERLKPPPIRMWSCNCCPTNSTKSRHGMLLSEFLFFEEEKNTFWYFDFHGTNFSFFHMQCGSQHSESRLWWRFYILWTFVEWNQGDVLAFCGTELRSIFTRRCHWWSDFAIQRCRIKPNWHTTAGTLQGNSTEKLKGIFIVVEHMVLSQQRNHIILSNKKTIFCNKIFMFFVFCHFQNLDSSTRTWWIVGIIVLATRSRSFDGCFVESSEFASHGCDRTGRPVCQDLFAVQWTKNRQKEDTR